MEFCSLLLVIPVTESDQILDVIAYGSGKGGEIVRYRHFVMNLQVKSRVSGRFGFLAVSVADLTGVVVALEHPLAQSFRVEAL
jgi:hypothetical protein